MTLVAQHIEHRGRARQSFTLVELIVVVAIIGIVLGLTLPGVTALWAERKVSETEAKIAGALKSARAAAMRDRAERGVLFVVDPVSNVQRLFRIEAEPPNRNVTPGKPEDSPAMFNVNAQDAKDRFVVRDGAAAVVTLPSPYRVVPRKVLDSAVWSDIELSNQQYRDNSLRHRNFFAVIFNADGHLVVDRTVYVHDYDPPTPLDSDDLGAVTGLEVADVDIGGVPKLGDIVVKLDDSPIDFRSVDGLLVYDDATFVEYGDPARRREYLVSTGQPLYIARFSGKIIRGPLGENQ